MNAISMLAVSQNQIYIKLPYDVIVTNFGILRLDFFFNKLAKSYCTVLSIDHEVVYNPIDR